MRVLVAGSGSIGRRHIANLRRLSPSAKVILMRCDARQDEYAEELGAQVVSSVHEGREAGADCLVIANPTALHAELIIAGMEARLPMYIEKPVVASLEEAQWVRTQAKNTGYREPVLVGCNLRFLPSLLALREQLKAGAIGRIARVNIEAGQWLPDWRPKVDFRKVYSARGELGGGVVLDLVHEFDAARWLLGELETVAAIGGKFEPLGIDAEAVCLALLRSTSGSPVVAVSIDYVARRLIRRYEFVGEEGSLVWDLPCRSLSFQAVSGVIELADPDNDFDTNKTYLDAMEEFINAVASGKATSQGLEEGLGSAELAIKVRKMICQQ